MNAPLHSEKRSCAFTLLELLVVIGLIGFGALMLLPALARTNPNTYAYQCLNNQRQLMAAWAMYPTDHNDTLVSNTGWISGVLTWDLRTDNTNSSLLVNAPAGLGRYIKSALPFKCPTDVYLSSVQRQAGWTGRVRSLSMNAFFGSGAFTPVPNYQLWLKQAHVPNPGRFWVLIEEHPDSINDSIYLNNPGGSSWTDLPGSLHNSGCCLAYADGRSEVHKWVSNATRIPVGLVFPPVVTNPGDYQWLMSRTSIPN